MRGASAHSLTRVAQRSARLRADLPLALLDVLFVVAAYGAVLALRFDGAVPQEYWQAFGGFLPLAVLVHVGANAACGLYGKIWRHAGVEEAQRVVLAGMAAVTALSLLYLPGQRDMPASVVLLGGPVALLLVGMLRFQSRLFSFYRRRHDDGTARVVVVGAGNAGGRIIREMLHNDGMAVEPVAVLDDDPRQRGRRIGAIPLAGRIDELRAVVEAYGADQVLLAIPSAGSDLVRKVAALSDRAGVALKVLPSVAEMVGTRPGVRDARDLSITDLLGRQQVRTDLDAVRRIVAGKRVLVTGGGGSIGSEIARQVSVFDPAALVLLDHDETHLHDAAARITGSCVQVLADIRDPGQIEQAFARHRPQVVFHAAALKHVPLLEGHPCEAFATNVMGTDTIVEASTLHRVERFVFISTDKAVRPLSVMGATKRLGEQLVLRRAPADSHYCAVRFGNVLGSRGSVVPTFMHQIDQGGPVTVTDKDMTRFFMSIEEAVQLVLQAAALASGGEVFMLDMGQPVRILDLARRMIHLAGRSESEVPIVFSGLRPGEKLTEELHTDDERPAPTAHPSLVRLRPVMLDSGLLLEGLLRLRELAARREEEQVTDLLFALARPSDLQVEVRLERSAAPEARVQPSLHGTY